MSKDAWEQWEYLKETLKAARFENRQIVQGDGQNAYDNCLEYATYKRAGRLLRFGACISRVEHDAQQTITYGLHLTSWQLTIFDFNTTKMTFVGGAWWWWARKGGLITEHSTGVYFLMQLLPGRVSVDEYIHIIPTAVYIFINIYTYNTNCRYIYIYIDIYTYTYIFSCIPLDFG